MKTRRIELSFPFEPGCLPDPELVVPIFHAWIRERALDEVLVDVARYGHVSEGPAVLLCGQATDYVIDVTRAGKRFATLRKRDAASDQERLADVARHAVRAAVLLEQSLPSVRLRTDLVTVRLIDRLNAPNTPQAFAALKEEVAAFARGWLGDAEVVHSDDPGGPLGFDLRRGRNEPVRSLLAGL
ncbi:MAG: hypothetical protein IPI67_04075 [Myxococcales bacterium]|nr:hypothetical protein [Myxococcales bacterium]